MVGALIAGIWIAILRCKLVSGGGWLGGGCRREGKGEEDNKFHFWHKWSLNFQTQSI